MKPSDLATPDGRRRCRHCAEVLPTDGDDLHVCDVAEDLVALFDSATDAAESSPGTPSAKRLHAELDRLRPLVEQFREWLVPKGDGG